MRKEYYDIYEMLYADYLYETRIRRTLEFPHDEHYLLRVLRKSIDKSDKENMLRPDAKYFLIVNFHHLIIRPLLEERPFRHLPNEKNFYELEDFIQLDIDMIIQETRSINIQEKISGHQIIQTIDRLWQKLKTNKLEIWG